MIVDATVIEKAIAQPTDARLCAQPGRHLVTLASDAGISLRQNYARLAPRLADQVGRYDYALSARAAFVMFWLSVLTQERRMR